MENIETLENQAKNGDVYSILEIAVLAIEDKYDKQKAIEYLLTAGEEYKGEVYYCLYELYEQKSNSDTKSLDYETAQKYLYQSAEFGNENAFWMIIKKEDEAKNYEKAIPYIQKFVEQNDGFAMAFLGDYYLEGKGVEASCYKALQFFNGVFEKCSEETIDEWTKETIIKGKAKIEGLKLAFDEGNISHILLQKKLSIGYPLASETFEWLLEKSYINKDGKTIISKEEYEKLFSEV